MTSTKHNCEAFAPIFLPDGATLTSMECYLEKTDPTDTPLVVNLGYHEGNWSFSLAAGSVSLPGSHHDAGYEKAGTVLNAVVDNSRYVYYLKFDPPDDTNTTNAAKNRVGLCRIGYTY